MSKVATCEWCGSTDVYFDAYIDVNGEVINNFENAYCAGECEGDIKYSYTITEAEESK